MSQLKLAYVMSFRRSLGTRSLWMKNMVLVLATLPSGSPCASLPNSLAADLFQIALYFGLCVSFLYLRYSPVLSSRMSCARSHCSCCLSCMWAQCGNLALLDGVSFIFSRIMCYVIIGGTCVDFFIALRVGVF